MRAGEQWAVSGELRRLLAAFAENGIDLPSRGIVVDQPPRERRAVAVTSRRTSSARACAGTRVATSCCASTSRPGSSTAIAWPTDGSLVPVRSYDVHGSVGAINPIDGDDGWLLALDRGIAHLAPDGTVRPIVELAPPDVKMNDAACDPQGRLWAGTIADVEAVPRCTGWSATVAPS